jgi:hypothetical protein
MTKRSTVPDARLSSAVFVAGKHLPHRTGTVELQIENELENLKFPRVLIVSFIFYVDSLRRNDD